jgi:hypothetical protein
VNSSADVGADFGGRSQSEEGAIGNRPGGDEPDDRASLSGGPPPFFSLLNLLTLWGDGELFDVRHRQELRDARR